MTARFSLSPRDVALGAALVWLTAATLVYVAMPPLARIRPVSIEGVAVPSLPIAPNATIKTEREWTAPQDVFVLGWSYSIPSNGGVLTLIAPPGDIVLCRVRGGDTDVRPQFLPSGAGVRLARGDKLRVRLEVTTLEAAGETHGALLLVYFVDARGN